MKSKIVPFATTFLIAFLGFASAAIAATPITPDDGSLLDMARPLFDAVMHGNYWLAAALAVVLLTAAAKKYLPEAYGGRLVRSDFGGMVTAFTLAFGGALATTMAAPGAAMTSLVALAALKIGFAAVGGFMLIHKLALMLVGTKFYQDKMPAPLKALMALVLGMIGSSAIARAEKAGQAAVDANPPKGPAAVDDVGSI